MRVSLKFNSWLSSPNEHPQAAIRLFCLSHVGGAAAIFNSWPKVLPMEIEVYLIQLPGHGDFHSEPAFTRMEPLVSSLAQILRPHLDKPFAFFGAGFGALILFETSQYLRNEKAPLPQHLFVSSCKAPQIFTVESPDPEVPVHLLSEQKLLEAMKNLHYRSYETFAEHGELRELTFPTILSDLEICAYYHHRPAAPLDCPITCFSGLEDPIVTLKELNAWNQQTQSTFRSFTRPGDHYFLDEEEEFILKTVTQDLNHRGK